MIKGVNRQIIEVMDTGNPYFERAMLVVRTGYTDTEAGRLREEAQKLLRRAGGYTGLKRQRRQRTIRATLFGLGAGSIGALLGVTIALLVH